MIRTKGGIIPCLCWMNCGATCWAGPKASLLPDLPGMIPDLSSMIFWKPGMIIQKSSMIFPKPCMTFEKSWMINQKPSMIFWKSSMIFGKPAMRFWKTTFVRRGKRRIYRYNRVFREGGGKMRSSGTCGNREWCLSSDPSWFCLEKNASICPSPREDWIALARFRMLNLSSGQSRH